ncbi:MAG: hypothetical protein Q8L55_14510, partial [Phycisphaerales bacterium]|nr:hypothetical protein [Phycisphaerales bacterium]
MIAPLILAAALLHPAAAAPAAPPAPLMQWNSAGFTPPAPAPGLTPITAPAATLIERILRTGGLLGGGTKGGESATTLLVDSDKLDAFRADPQHAVKFADLPASWLTLDTARKESAFLALTIDANAMRASAEALFDAPWFQRLLDRLALDNARTLTLRAAILPAPSDTLPPMLELKAAASSRSAVPGPCKPITLIAGGWSGTSTDAAAVTGAHWAASLRFDSAGLGTIGRSGGVGTLAGLLRLTVDAVGTANAADTAAWDKAFDTWQDRSADALRSLSTRLQQRATLGCYGTTAAPNLVLVIPSRRGERAETLNRAIEQLAAAGGLATKNGIWTLTDRAPLIPSPAIMVCDTASGPYLVIS